MKLTLETIVYICLMMIMTVFYLKKNNFWDLSILSIKQHKIRKVYFFLGIFFLLFVWSLGADFRPTGITRIPYPSKVIFLFLKKLSEQEFLINIWISIKRVFIGFGFSAILGMSLGLLAGTFLFFKSLLQPGNTFMRYIPPSAFVSLLIVYFGIGESYKYAVIFVGVFFFFIQMTIDAVNDIDRKYIELGLVSGFTKDKIFRRIIFAATFPRLFDITRINLSGAWTFLVISEVIGSQNGLGYIIAISQRFYRIEELYVAIFAFGVIGLIFDFVLLKAKKQIFLWVN